MEHYLFVLLIPSMAIVMNFGVEAKAVYKCAEYEWNSQENAINCGTYNLYMCVFANKAEDGRVFITIAKVFGPGVPATLTTVINKTGPGSPLSRPYPYWSWHNSSCIYDSIVNVYQVHIQCNYIFILDTGVIDQICNLKLLIFNLKNDTLVKTIYILFDMATNRTSSGLLVASLVYIPGKCTRFLDKMIVFTADLQDFGLVMYDSSTKRMCRVETDCMSSIDTSYSITNQNFTYVQSIFGMPISNEFYYSAASGKEICKMKINTLLESSNKEETNNHSKVAIKLSSQTVQITSMKHTIFYTNTLTSSIIGTNVYKTSDKNAVVLAQDVEKFQVVCSMQVSRYWNQLTFLSNKFQRLILNTLMLNETNFRYFEMNLTEIQKKMD